MSLQEEWPIISWSYLLTNQCKEGVYMATLEYISNRQLLRDYPNGTMSQHFAKFGPRTARHLPHLLKERSFDFGTADKIFCSEWLSESDVALGTKCSKLFVLDTVAGTRIELPSLNGLESLSTGSSGIRSLCLSPNDTLLAVGSGNDLAVYTMPDLCPLVVGEAHSDWIFDVQWITDCLLITGSRDSSMALWTVDGIERKDNQLAEDVQSISPIFKFSNHPQRKSSTTPQSTTTGERVRSLTYEEHSHVVGSLQAGPCSAAIHFWDVFVFQQISRSPLPYCSENVCLEYGDETALYVVGSRSHVTLIDKRETGCKTAGFILSPDKDCGVRSLQFNDHLLSIGTGAGHVYFYDVRAAKFITGCDSSKPISLHSSHGWLRKDQTYRDFFSGLPLPPSSIYTHRYNSSRTKIFTAGGPLPLGLFGNYAALWT